MQGVRQQLLRQLHEHRVGNHFYDPIPYSLFPYLLISLFPYFPISPNPTF